jgi:hypothetical protein
MLTLYTCSRYVPRYTGGSGFERVNKRSTAKQYVGLSTKLCVKIGSPSRAMLGPKTEHRASAHSQTYLFFEPYCNFLHLHTDLLHVHSRWAPSYPAAAPFSQGTVIYPFCILRR